MGDQSEPMSNVLDRVKAIRDSLMERSSSAEGNPEPEVGQKRSFEGNGEEGDDTIMLKKERISKKIWIPTEKYPDENIVGVLLGPGSSHLKKLQQIAGGGSKVSVRGKGCNADPNRGEVPSQEPLHVLVDGSPEGIAAVEKELDTLFSNPDNFNSLKAQQRASLTSGPLSNTGPNPYGPGLGSLMGSNGISNPYSGSIGDLAGASTQLAFVPNNAIGLVIGRGGDMCKRIQHESGLVKLDIESDSSVTNPNERKITMYGSKDAINRAFRQIKDLVMTKTGINLSSLPNNAGIANDVADYVVDPNNAQSFTASLEVQIPNEKAGLVIGAKGSNIRNIKLRTGANIQIPPDADVDDPSVRTITVMGATMDIARKAEQEIMDILRNNAIASGNPNLLPGGGSGVLIPPTPKPDESQDSLFVPNDKVGVVIGKQGSTITGLMNRHNCNVFVPPEPDRTSNLRKVTLTGPYANIQACKKEIEGIVEYSIQNSMQKGMQRYGSGGSYNNYGGPGGGRGPPPYPSYGGSSSYGHHGHGQQPYSNYSAPPPGGYGAPPPPQYGQAPAPYHQQPPPPSQPGSYYGGYATNSTPYPPQQPQAQYPGYGQQPQQPQAPQTTSQAPAYSTTTTNTTTSTMAPQTQQSSAPPPTGQTDYTAYYKEFWNYAAYYGEAHARTAYGLYAPPQGTPPPPGIVLPTNPPAPPK